MYKQVSCNKITIYKWSSDRCIIKAIAYNQFILIALVNCLNTRTNQHIITTTRNITTSVVTYRDIKTARGQALKSTLTNSNILNGTIYNKTTGLIPKEKIPSIPICFGILQVIQSLGTYGRFPKSSTVVCTPGPYIFIIFTNMINKKFTPLDPFSGKFIIHRKVV